MTPHRVHLLEMRASRPDAAEVDKIMARVARTSASTAAMTPVEPPVDATARHLAEMRAGREVQGG